MRISVPIAAIALHCAASTPALAQHEAHGTTASPTAPAARVHRFPTEAVLRGHMAGIRDAVAALDHYRHGHMGPEQARILADGVEAHVRAIIAQCRLPPDADAALHGIIVPLLEDAAALKARPKELGPIASMEKSLQQYSLRFDDPTFKASK